MRTSDFNFDLPIELIAQRPVEPRDRARLLRINGVSGEFEDRFFSDLPEILRPDDLLVVNNTKVIPARLWGTKPTGGRVEVLLLGQSSRPGFMYQYVRSQGAAELAVDLQPFALIQSSLSLKKSVLNIGQHCRKPFLGTPAAKGVLPSDLMTW